MRNHKILLPVLLFTLCVILASAPARAEQTNFSVAPPPIASPYFEAGKGEGKFRFTYLTIEGQGMDMKGGGIDFVGRTAFSEHFAGDIAFGFLFMNAEFKSTDPLTTGSDATMTLMNMPFSANLEVQPYKGDILSTIIFLGPAMIMTPGSMETTIMGQTYSSTLFGFYYGAQAGLQLGVKLGDFNLSPFAMAQSMQGTMTITDSQGNSFETDVPAYTTTSYGADLIYTPWGLTLSSVLQEAKKTDEQTPGFKTHLYTLSFTKQF
ncbi:MAG: hypothetical protein OEW15_04960 [Nitrospirota bacterium]|nr:hypothetical protein [Nitrospirota bacterium]